MVPFDSDPPCDFLTYLESRLGKDQDVTTKLLGEWLATYEPERHTARTYAARRVGERDHCGDDAT
jgi:hypothetical protein